MPVSPADPGSESVVTPVALEVLGTALTEPQFLAHRLARFSSPSSPSSVQVDIPAPVFSSDPAALCFFSDINCSPQVLRDAHMECLQPPTCSGGMEPS